MHWYNHPPELRTAYGEPYRPTRVLMPAWQTAEAQMEGEDNFQQGEFELRLLSKGFDVGRAGLQRSPMFPQLPLTLEAGDLRAAVQSQYPVDKKEIVEWMQDSTAMEAVLSARVAEYNQHSLVLARTGDSYSPGVRVEDVAIVSQPASTVRSAGSFLANTPAGPFRVPNGAGLAIVSQTVLAWVGGLASSYGGQWLGVALKWVDLAKTPITRSIGFPSFLGYDIRTLPPNFFVQEPSSSGSRVRNRLRIQSDRQQTLHFVFRSPSNYTQILDEGDIQVDAGTWDVEFVVLSYPSVPVVVTEVRPQGLTVLQSYHSEVIS